MNYEHQLAYNLRSRGIAEDQIAEVLEEVNLHTATTGAAAESEFGTADEYASTFKKVKSHTRGVKVMIVASILAVVYVVLIFALKGFFNFEIEDLVGQVELWPAISVILLGAIVGFLTDYLRPPPRSGYRNGSTRQ